MSVAYSCIDVQIQLQDASFVTSSSVRDASPALMTFTAAGLQATRPSARVSLGVSLLCLTVPPVVWATSPFYVQDAAFWLFLRESPGYHPRQQRRHLNMRQPGTADAFADRSTCSGCLHARHWQVQLCHFHVVESTHVFSRCACKRNTRLTWELVGTLEVGPVLQMLQESKRTHTRALALNRSTSIFF
jgi:hypothetical protein